MLARSSQEMGRWTSFEIGSNQDGYTENIATHRISRATMYLKQTYKPKETQHHNKQALFHADYGQGHIIDNRRRHLTN